MFQMQSRRSWLGSTVLATCGLAALGSSGCAAAPLDGTTIQTNSVTTFAGYAIEAGADIRVQALTVEYFSPNLPSATWETLTPPNLKASTTPNWGSFTNYDRAVYDWSVSLYVPGKYFKDGRVFLRSQERVGANWVSMFSFDRLGQECLLEHAADANRDGVPLNVQSAGVDCSRDVDGDQLTYVELAKPGRLPDLIPEWYDANSHSLLWLVPDIFEGNNAALFPIPGGPPAELVCGARWMNIALKYENQGAAVMTQRRDRVAIPELGLEDIDVQPRIEPGSWGDSLTSGVLFPPTPGRYATFDLASTIPNHVYTIDLRMNYDQAIPESDYTNNHLQVEFVRKCP